jgi:hypothetical protein
MRKSTKANVLVLLFSSLSFIFAVLLDFVVYAYNPMRIFFYAFNPLVYLIARNSFYLFIASIVSMIVGYAVKFKDEWAIWRITNAVQYALTFVTIIALSIYISFVFSYW